MQPSSSPTPSFAIPPNLPEPWATACREVCAWIAADLPARAIIVSGTVVRGGGDRASDLDIQVINRESWSQRQTRLFAEVPCEIFVNPVHRLVRWYREEASEGCPSTAHMVATGAVVYDPDGICADLQAEARTWLDRPPTPNPVRLNQAKYGPATWIEDSLDVLQRDPELAILFAGEALPRILDAWFLDRRRVRPRRKDRLQVLEAEDPAAAVLLRRALAAPAIRDRVTAAGDLCQRLLGVRGTFAWESPREPVPEPLPQFGTLRLDAGGGVVLRDAIDTDIELIFAIIDRERDRLGRFMGWVAATREVDDVRAYFRSQQADVDAARVRHFTILVEDRLVGRISLENIKQTEKKVLIGYWLSAAVEGRGVMTRALTVVCDHAFGELGLERLSLFTHPDNQRSQEVARRCGFRQEGVFRQAAMLNGERVDQLWFARLRAGSSPTARLPQYGTLRLDAGGGVLLRDQNDADLPAVFAIIENERERMARFLTPLPKTLADLQLLYRDFARECIEGRRRILVILLDGRLVGRIFLKGIDHTVKTCEIGYFVSQNAEGRGVMTRSLAAVCDHAFKDLGLERLTLSTHPDNHRSQTVARRCGFRQEGVFRQAAILNGERVDQVWFARLRGDPPPGNPSP